MNFKSYAPRGEKPRFLRRTEGKRIGNSKSESRNPKEAPSANPKTRNRVPCAAPGQAGASIGRFRHLGPSRVVFLSNCEIRTSGFRKEDSPDPFPMAVRERRSFPRWVYLRRPPSRSALVADPTISDIPTTQERWPRDGGRPKPVLSEDPKPGRKTVVGSRRWEGRMSSAVASIRRE